MPGHLPQFGYATRIRADTTTPHRMTTFWCMLHLLSFRGQKTGCFNIPLCIFITQICPTTYLAFAAVCTECVLEVVSLATVRRCTDLNQWRRLNLYFMSYNNYRKISMNTNFACQVPPLPSRACTVSHLLIQFCSNSIVIVNTLLIHSLCLTTLYKYLLAARYRLTKKNNNTKNMTK